MIERSDYDYQQMHGMSDGESNCTPWS